MENIPEYHTRQQSTENLNNGTLDEVDGRGESRHAQIGETQNGRSGCINTNTCRQAVCQEDA